MNRLSAVAPSIQVEITHISNQTPKMLESGDADLAVGYMPALEAGFYQQKLFDQNFACVVQREHPRVRSRLTRQAFRRERHALVPAAGTGHELVERELERLGVSRRIVLRLPNLLGIGALVANCASNWDLPQRLPRATSIDRFTIAPLNSIGGRSAVAPGGAPVRCANRLSGLRRLARGTALLFCAAPMAHAAGGHFAVDDAAILDIHQCQLESWEEFETGGARSLFHFGPSCRVGPVELGLNVDRLRSRGREASTVFGPQAKWAVAVDDDFSVGLVGLVGWQGKAPRYAGATLYLPFSLHVAPPLWLHANGGRDWYRGAASTSRLGLALEWDLGTTWTMTGELFRQASGNFARLGTRWQASPNVSIDMSRASALGVRSSGWWSLGANWAFEVDRARP